MRTRGPRRLGLAYVETVVASVVFALTLAGVAATMMTQEKLLRAIEQRTCVLVPVHERTTLERDPETGMILARVETLATDATIQAVTYGHMPDFGPVPRLLTVVDRRRSHWPAGGRVVLPPAISATLLGNDGSVPPYERLFTLSLVELPPTGSLPVPEPAPGEGAGLVLSTVTVDQFPTSPGG